MPIRSAAVENGSGGDGLRVKPRRINGFQGTDIDERGGGTIIEQRLYQLIRQREPVADRQFEIEFLDPGAEAFVFTFG